MPDQPDTSTSPAQLPADDLARQLTTANADDPTLPHIGLVGDSYTILLSSEDTAGKYTLIDMYVPPGGGPAPHRHDFEESFTILEGEVESTFRGNTSTVKAGETVNIPANAPHQFTNRTDQAVRLLCICAPAGQDEFFMEVGVEVASRTTPPPPLSESEQKAFIAKAKQLAPQYVTELL